MELNFFYSNIIIIPIITFLTSVIVKGLLLKIIEGSFSMDKAFGSGGMPSVHSAIVVSLTTAIALKYGISTDIFALAMTFTVIIIYDAINVRFEAGLHASAINERLGEKKFKESLGHLPSEAFAGSILGILVAIALFYI